MKIYVKPEVETIALRIEERISSCAEGRLVSLMDDIFSATCFVPGPTENVWSADCYRITNAECS